VSGAVSGVAVDPIEKKPLYHFLPGSKVLSFGTVGCTLRCRFCQNWSISQAGDPGRLQEQSPKDLAAAAVESGCPSVAFTYNEPGVFAEFALETAQTCRDRDLRTVAVSAGFFQPAPAREFFGAMDVANIDLKAFSDRFYSRICGGRLAPVLDTLGIIRHETACWLEVTTLLVPGENDSDAELTGLCRWVARNLGPEVPLHFSAFHPGYRMADRTATPASTVDRARRIALGEGLQFVYSGNVRDPEGSATRCPACASTVIRRDGFRVAENRMGAKGVCPGCGKAIPGVFDPR
jgi:pyruvate formate lyase activating enzyme